MVRRAHELERETREGMRGGKGAVRFEHLLKDGLPRNGRVLAKLTLPPGASIGGHTHAGETEVFYIKR